MPHPPPSPADRRRAEALGIEPHELALWDAMVGTPPPPPAPRPVPFWLGALLVAAGIALLLLADLLLHRTGAIR